MDFKHLKKDHFGVYVLLKNKNPVYVGCTCNLRGRLANHKVSKDFDNYVILKQFKDKKIALIFERAIITYLSAFGDENIINGKIDKMTIIKYYI